MSNVVARTDDIVSLADEEVMHLVQDGDPRAFELLLRPPRRRRLLAGLSDGRQPRDRGGRRPGGVSLDLAQPAALPAPTAAAFGPGCSGSSTTARSTRCGATSCTTAGAPAPRASRSVSRRQRADRRRGRAADRGGAGPRRARRAARRAVACDRTGLLRRLQPQPDRGDARYADRNREGPDAAGSRQAAGISLDEESSDERRAPRDARGERRRVPARRARRARGARLRGASRGVPRLPATRSTRLRPAVDALPRSVHPVEPPARAEAALDGRGRGATCASARRPPAFAPRSSLVRRRFAGAGATRSPACARRRRG